MLAVVALHLADVCSNYTILNLKRASNNSIFSLPATPIFHKGSSCPITIFRGALINRGSIFSQNVCDIRFFGQGA
jgi:hypothetical protein